jgi:hypothetical protein
LELRAAGDRLVVRGPKRLERLALEVLGRKAEMLPLITAGPSCAGRESASPTLGSAGQGREGTADRADWARRAAALLSGVADPDRRTDLRELFEHRAAICEFDGGLSRVDAERMAYAELSAAIQRSGRLA